MKLIIAGSRTIDKYRAFFEAFKYLMNQEDSNKIEEFVTGACDKGADQVPYLMKETTCETPIKAFPADWSRFGAMAGPARNRQMAEYADRLLLVWDGKSKGSANMKAEMLKLGKPVHEIIIKIPFYDI